MFSPPMPTFTLNAVSRLLLSLPLIFALNVPSLGQQSLGVISETQFDLAADALIREAENPDTGPSFIVLRQNILKLFNSLPPVIQQKVRIEKYDERLSQVESKWFPQLGLSAGYKSYRRDEETLGRTNPLNATVLQQVWDFGTTGSEKRQIQAEQDVEVLSVRLARSETLLKCVRATLNLQKTRRQEFFVLGFVNSRKSFAKFMEQRKELGAASEMDLVRAKAKVAQAMEQIPTVRAQVSKAKADYEAVFGIAPTNISGDYYRLPFYNSDYEEERIRDLAKNSLRVKAQRSKVEASVAKVDQLKASQYGVIQGQLNVVGGESTISGYSRQSTVGLEYKVELFDGFKLRSAIAEAALTSTEQLLELDQIQRDQFVLLSQAKSNLESAKETYASRIDLLRSTRAIDAGTRELFTLDRASITDVFREQEAHFTAAQQLIEGIFQRDIAVYEFLHAFDELIPTFEVES